MSSSAIAINKLEDTLLVRVPAELVDREVIALRRNILAGVRRFRSRLVILDFSEVVICDTYFGRFVHGCAHMSRLMGADVVVCGLQDAVVETLVDMGFELPVVTALDVDDALALSRKRRKSD